ncbi:MAG: asparaginase [Gammaproteobacteria bacterium]|nr:asparaginase [Gammaproteobacteria bacterium]
MNNPILAEVTRGGVVESRHRGSLAVVDTKGRTVLSLGDIETPVFPRSAIKALQAVASFETGAIEKFGLNNAEIAIACASHTGESAHVNTAAGILKKAGLGHNDLECGSHWPTLETAHNELAGNGDTPSDLHNNCSGKHANMLVSAVCQGLETRGYIQPDHAVQRRVKDVLESFCETSLNDAPMGIDGCSVPNWAMPLEKLAYGFARFGTGYGLDRDRVKLCEKIRVAVVEHPFMVAGTGRFCTRIMEQLGASAFVKTGAEGVFCASLPELGLGVALKIDDGAKRASELVMAQLIHKFGIVKTNDFSQELVPDVLNRNSIKTGEILAATALDDLTI